MKPVLLRIFALGFGLTNAGLTISGEFELLLGECHRHYENSDFEAAERVAEKLADVADPDHPIQRCWACGWKSRIELKQGDIQQAEREHRNLLATIKANVPNFQKERETLQQDWAAGNASPLWLVMPLVAALEGEIALVTAKKHLEAVGAAHARERKDLAAREAKALKDESKRAETCFREALAIQKSLDIQLEELVAECYEGLGEAHELRSETEIAIAYFREAVDVYEGVEQRWGHARQLQRRIESLEKSLGEDTKPPGGR
jgi:tetratricopeptide (TPR) repeat protein